MQQQTRRQRRHTKRRHDLIGKTDAEIFSHHGQAAQFRADELAVLAGTPLIDKEEILIRSRRQPADTSDQQAAPSGTAAERSSGLSSATDTTSPNANRRKKNCAKANSNSGKIAENIREVFWVTDPAKQQMVYVSPAYENIWGRTCQSLYDAPGTWLEAIHPDDRERVLEAALTKQTVETSAVYDEEYRIIKPDKTCMIWIHDRGVSHPQWSG